jgi:hypothetical protein
MIRFIVCVTPDSFAVSQSYFVWHDEKWLSWFDVFGPLGPCIVFIYDACLCQRFEYLVCLLLCLSSFP